MARTRKRRDAHAETTEREFEALQKATGHTCPPWCHKCPLMDGMVMPGCCGTVHSACGPYDMSSCYCDRKSLKARETDLLRQRVEKLEEEVRRLTNPGGTEG